jgi:sec-independent protein translocase protein TatC
MSDDSNKMPFFDHLNELRSRLIYCLIALAAGFLICYSFSNYIIDILKVPILNALPQGSPKALHVTGLMESFLTHIKVSIVAAFFVATPFILYQVWSFISPGLYDKEKRHVVPFVGFGTIFFILGILFGYFVVFPYGFPFLLNFGGGQEIPILTLREYFTLAIKLLLIFGIVFELPIFLVFLSIVGIVNYQRLAKYRRYVLLIIAMVSAFFTPPDIITMVAMSIPLYMLYEISILVIWVMERFRK